MSLEYTINRERFAGLNIRVYHGFQEYRENFPVNIAKCLSIIILNNEHFWPGQLESISAKTLIGLKT